MCSSDLMTVGERVIKKAPEEAEVEVKPKKKRRRRRKSAPKTDAAERGAESVAGDTEQ